MSMIMRWKWRNRSLSSRSVSGFMLKYFECSWNNSIESWNGYYVWLNENKYFIWGEVKYAQVVNFIIIFFATNLRLLDTNCFVSGSETICLISGILSTISIACFLFYGSIFFFLHLKFMFCFWVGNTPPLCQLIYPAIKRMKYCHLQQRGET